MDERNENLEIQNDYEEKKRKKEIEHKRRIKVLLAKTSLMGMLFMVSTYAWFTSQKDITLSNIRGTVEVVENMEISLDAKTWHQKIDLSNAETAFYEAQLSRDEALNETNTKSTALAILPEKMFPVSGVGQTGLPVLPLYTAQAATVSLSEIVQCEEEEVRSGIDIAKDNGYIAFDMYIKNTSRDNEVDVLQLNINSAAQVLTETVSKMITDVTGNRVHRDYYGNEASGLQNTVRIALAKYAGEVSSTSTQLEILNSTKDANIADVAIWEPNAYDHVEAVVINNNKLINGSSTNKIQFTNYHPNNPLETYAINEDGKTSGRVENFYDITSNGLEAQNTFKTDNIKDGNEIKSYRIKTIGSKPVNIKNTSNNNFEISANTVTRYRVYIWLEGQDVDCINLASQGGGIELDLGLTKDDETGDVISEVENRVTLNITEITSDPVTATITMNKEITELPNGWEYTDGTKLAIKKTYSINTIEQVEVKTEDSKISKIEVVVNNIDTLARKIIGNEATVYGEYTNYPVDIDGDSTDYDWRIFYANGNDVFLIADDYVKNSVLVNDEMTKVTETRYKTYCSTFQGKLNTTSIESSVANKYLLRQAKQNTQENYRITAHMLNTSVWNIYFKNTTYAESAIGGPTIEMLIDSWNTKFYGNEDYAQFCYAWTTIEEGAGGNGYKMGKDVANSDSVSLTGIDKEVARMYVPHYREEDNLDGTEEGDCYSYWLASPSAHNMYCVNYVSCYGYIGYCTGSGANKNHGIRPVVSLKPGISATKVGDVWELDAN